MRISIFGLGYVGTVCAGCLAQEGHQIIGVDPVPTKVDLINAGKSTIIEAEIGELIAKAVESGRLRATDKTAEAIENSELSFVCVGTPSQINGNLDLTHVRHVCEQIGRALKNNRERHTVVIRSTVLPGTMRKDRHSGPGGIFREKGWDWTSEFAITPSSSAKARRLRILNSPLRQ